MEIPPRVDVRQSIEQMRRVYKDYSEHEFANWYSMRYGIRYEAVLAVMRGVRP